MKNKTFTCLFSIVFICTSAFAQPLIKKQFVIGGKLNDELRAMSPTKDGGGIAGGSSESPISGDKTQKSRGSFDYWIVKQDSMGNILWDKTIGGDGWDKLSSLAQATDGGYILGGSSNSEKSGEKSEGHDIDFSMDYWVVKTDKRGNVVWDKTIGGTGDDYLTSIAQTADGGYVAGGYSQSDKSRDKSQNNRGFNSNDYWIVKLDQNGNIEWDKTIGGSLDDILTSLQQTKDGGYILGGYSESNTSGEKTENSRGGLDYWVVKLNAKGNIEWDKTIGGDFTDRLTCLQQTSDDRYILGGYSYSNRSGEKSENIRGYFDYWLVKIDHHGNVQWDKTIGGDNVDELTSLQQTMDGGYILGGGSNSGKSGEKTENSRNNSYDYWVVKVNDNGRVQWDKTIGGSSYEYLYAVKEIGRNRFMLGGTGPGVSLDKTELSKGGYDYWLVKLNYKEQSNDIITSSSDQEIITKDKNTYNIYPNPVKDILNVQTSGTAELILLNQSGKVLIRTTINGYGEVNTSKLSAGIYYLKNNTTGETKKIIITK